MSDEQAKFNPGDRVRRKDGTGYEMTVVGNLRHPGEPSTHADCTYLGDNGGVERHSIAIDDLELIPPEEE